MSDTDATTPQVRMPLLIALGLLAVAALVYFLVVVPGQDDGVADVDETQATVGSEPAGVGSEPALVEPGVTPEVDATEEASEDDADEPAFEVFDARDPFEQLVADDVGGVGETGDTAATTPVTGTGDAIDTPVDSAPAGTDVTQSQTSVDATTIMLEEVFDEDGRDMVIVQVGGEGYEAAEGDTVAGNLTVLDIADSCATMRYDDTRFILCEGEQLRK